MVTPSLQSIKNMTTLATLDSVIKSEHEGMQVCLHNIWHVTDDCQIGTLKSPTRVWTTLALSCPFFVEHFPHMLEYAETTLPFSLSLSTRFKGQLHLKFVSKK